MKKYLPNFVLLLVILGAFSLPALAQVSNSGSITGTVKDPQDASVPNATVTVKNNATGEERTATTSDNGIFNVPQLGTGVYTVTVESGSGFKKAQVTAVKVDVGLPTTVNVTLELGNPQETVTIIGGGEVLQTQTANVGNTIVGRQITELPFTSRDALDLVLALPGTQTPARPRSSTINGLPRGSLTITLDGLPDQAEDSKSSDGFFTFVRPRIDAIEEVSLSSAVPGAESSGDGAVQIKFSTRGGTSEFHGSGYWYHRNTSLNANYYFNNLAGIPRQRMLLNQPGVRVSGPILIPHLMMKRDKAFFFVNYEEFRLPGSTARARNVLAPDAEKGIFHYGSGGALTKDLFALAASKGQTSTVDPIIGSMIGKIRSSLSQGSLAPLGDNQQRFNWNSPANQVRKFTSVRFDFNLTPKHHLENVWNYNVFNSSPDQLNSRDEIFPGIPIGVGGQYSLRFSNSTALRSTFKPNLINEFRIGWGAGGTVLFFPETNPAAFAVLGGFNTSFTVFSPGGNNTSSPASGSGSSRNHAPAKIFLDNLSYVHGNHSFNFGVDIAQYNAWSQSLDRVVPAITFGFNANDPANASSLNMWTTCPNTPPIPATCSFPGASSTDITNAKNLYALLTGRVTAITASAFTSEDTGKYTYLGDFVQRLRQRTAGFYAQDSWRFRPNLTINAGLRYELQFPYTVLNNNYTQAVGGYTGVWGISGVGNLFKPGTLTGSVTQFVPFPQGEHPYEVDWNNFGPSIGVAWSPKTGGGFLRHLIGQSGNTVIRAGYSIAFVREGTDVMNAIIGGNPGGTLSATRSITLGNLTAGTLFRNPAALAPPTIPSAPSYPMTPTSTPPYSPSNSVNAFIPNLKVGWVQSYSFGIQRELNKDTVLEARYVGNRGMDLWHQYNLNEANLTENGFINEFRLAQLNYQAHVNSGLCGGSGQPACSFAYRGPGTNTFPLPIILGYFRGAGSPTTASNYTGSITAPSGATVNLTSLFADTGFTGLLSPNNANARTFASNLWGDADRRALGILAGLAPNLFIANPNFVNTNLANGGAFVVDNSGSTRYDALQIELRRRMSRGLLIQGSYTFSKSMSNMYGTSGSVFFQPTTLRNSSLDHNLSPFDLKHAFKANWIWELPFGRGQWLASNADGVVDRLVGGWAIHGQARIQSGSTLSLGNVQLVGMTAKDLQNAIKIRPDSTGSATVFFLPDDIILNTRRAFNTTPTGFGTLGAPTGRYIAPANSNGCIQEYVGQCGFSNLILHGPGLTRFDISLVKKTKITETANFEIRAEFLNAFNNINFKVGSQTAADTSITNFSATTFGQTSNAYQDLSTTNDVGGRMIQIVLRINW